MAQKICDLCKEPILVIAGNELHGYEDIRRFVLKSIPKAFQNFHIDVKNNVVKIIWDKDTKGNPKEINFVF